MVLREDPRCVEHLGAGLDRRGVNRVDLIRAGCSERDVQFTGLLAVGRPDPEPGEALSTRKAHDGGGSGRIAGRFGEPDRPEDSEIESDRGVDVSGLDTYVIEHDGTLAAPSDRGGRAGTVARRPRSRRLFR